MVLVALSCQYPKTMLLMQCATLASFTYVAVKVN